MDPSIVCYGTLITAIAECRAQSLHQFQHKMTIVINKIVILANQI